MLAYDPAKVLPCDLKSQVPTAALSALGSGLPSRFGHVTGAGDALMTPEVYSARAVIRLLQLARCFLPRAMQYSPFAQGRDTGLKGVRA